MTSPSEFDLIERIRAGAADHPSVPVGIGDDAAVLRPSPGRELIASTDSLIPNRHFLPHWPPEVIGHLALAVNLSDLAAMGATPRWVLLALTLPEAEAKWLDGFLSGFLRLAVEHQVILVGGNLARGPLNIGVQVLGETELGQAVLRSTAVPGDVIAVTGTLGDAAAALAFNDQADPVLHQRWQQPSPRLAAGQLLAPLAHAMMDISDGLLADLGKLIKASNCGAVVELEKLPASPALQACVVDAQTRQRIQAEGGSDYELLLTLDQKRVAQAQSALSEIGESLTVIGKITDGASLLIHEAEHQTTEFNRDGWDHFRL